MHTIKTSMLGTANKKSCRSVDKNAGRWVTAWHRGCEVQEPPPPPRKYTGHNYTGHTYKGLTYIGLAYLGHTYVGHNYIGNTYTGHNYIGHNRSCALRPKLADRRKTKKVPRDADAPGNVRAPRAGLYRP